MESIGIAEMNEEEREQNVKGPSETTADEYREMIDKLLSGIDWTVCGYL